MGEMPQIRKDEIELSEAVSDALAQARKIWGADRRPTEAQVRGVMYLLAVAGWEVRRKQDTPS